MKAVIARLALMAVILSLTAIRANAATTTGGGVVLTPSDSQGNVIESPGFFEVTGAPGSVTNLNALVGNIQPRTVTIVMAPVDAKSGVYGGISYNLPQQPRKLVGAWIRLSDKSFRVPSHKAHVVGVRVRIPAAAKPGQYVGGVTAYVPALSHGELVVQLRRVVAVVVTVTGGPLFGRFSLGRVRAKKRPDATYVISQIHNTGTTLLKGQGHLWVWAVGRRRPVISTAISLDTTVPHTTVYYPVKLARKPARSNYSYKITVRWGTNGTATKSGNFVVSK